MLFTNVLENLIMNAKGFLSLAIAVLGVIAIAWYIIQARFKFISAALTFIFICFLSYIVFNPSLVRNIGEMIYNILFQVGG